MKKLLFIFSILAIGGLSSCVDEDESSKRLQAEIKQIDQYLASTGTLDYILYDNSSGIRFVIHQFGDNPPAHTGQIISASFTGRLFSDGTIFDIGTINTQIENVAGEGLQYCLSSMMAGTSATLYIPSYLGFGQTGTSSVPPNSILIYEVYISDVTKTSTEQSQFTSDTVALRSHINDNMIDATLHESGVWYSIEEQGTGGNPHVYSIVSIDYKLTLLSNGTVIDQGTDFQTSVFGVIDGLKVGLPLLNEGGKATFYIPSGLGYGKDGASSIPANSNLVFEITLKSVLE